MPFYIRKSVSLGPIRFNLSKSGIGTSVGVTGFRLGSGPRGNYVHMGRHGLYFRKSLGPSTKSKLKNYKQVLESAKRNLTDEKMMEIESSSVDQMVDSSSQDLLEDLNKALNRVRIFPISRFLGILFILAILLTSWPGWMKFIYTIFLAVGIVVCYFTDKTRKSVVILFNLEEPAESLYKRVYESFDELIQCERTWHVTAEGVVQNEKYSGGAAENIRRNEIDLRIQEIPPIKTNIDVPQIPVGEQILAFMPDRLLVFEAKKVGAVAYEDLNIDVTSQRFIESGQIPGDAKIIGQTWKYVNKDGEPDRRFKDNPQYPVVRYEFIHFSSSTGLNEEICLSRVGDGQPFEDAVRNFSEYFLSTR